MKFFWIALLTFLTFSFQHLMLFLFSICCQFIPTSIFINYIMASAVLMPLMSLQRNHLHKLEYFIKFATALQNAFECLKYIDCKLSSVFQYRTNQAENQNVTVTVISWGAQMFVISHSFAVTPHFLMCASKIVPVHSKKFYIQPWATISRGNRRGKCSESEGRSN